MVAQIPALQASIGDIARFRLVVDANFVISELIHRVRHPERGASAFVELVKATLIEVFAPRWLETEMTTSAIPKAAKRSKVPEDKLRAAWAEFKPMLKWDETLGQTGTPTTDCIDLKDLPYVQLQKKLNADGILSKDTDISRMGGHLLTLDFVFSTRAYARSLVTTVSIRVMTVYSARQDKLPGVYQGMLVGAAIAAVGVMRISGQSSQSEAPAAFVPRRQGSNAPEGHRECTARVTCLDTSRSRRRQH